MMETGKKSLEKLNLSDECTTIEAWDQGKTEKVTPINAPPGAVSAPVREALVNQFPREIMEKLPDYTGRISDKADLSNFICELCSYNDLSVSDLSILLNKGEKYLLFNFVKPLREAGKLEYTYPEMPNHPQQAYRTVTDE